MSVKIPVAVKSGANGSYIQADNLVAGAQSSYNDVVLRMTLEDEWANTPSVIANFTDAHGENIYTVLLLDSMKVEPGNVNCHTYDVPIPAAAKVYEGDLSVVLTGFSQVIGKPTVINFNGDGVTTEFTIPGTHPVFIIRVTVGGEDVPLYDWSYNYTDGTVTLKTAPASGTDNVAVYYNVFTTEYIIRTTNCFMRVLPSAFSVVADNDLQSDVLEQLLAEMHDMRAALSEKTDVAVWLAYYQDETPTAEDADEYWYAPTSEELYHSKYTGGSYVWEDVSDEKLKNGRFFLFGGAAQLYICFNYDLIPISAVPVQGE